MIPVKITLTPEKKLSITWDDGRECLYPLTLLRRKCPCAACTTDYESKGPGYIPLFTKDASTLKKIDPLGYYALQFTWADGHNTGIYRYEYLREICEQ